MKTVKSALLGIKNLIDRDTDVLLSQLKEVIKEHRAIIITRLIGDLPTYLDYKFQLTKPTRKQLDEVKDKLLSLKNDPVQLPHYDSVVQQLQARAVIHLTNEPFYAEIDDCVTKIISPEQIKICLT